jgi:hypothetical protein
VAGDEQRRSVSGSALREGDTRGQRAQQVGVVFVDERHGEACIRRHTGHGCWWRAQADDSRHT